MLSTDVNTDINLQCACGARLQAYLLVRNIAGLCTLPALKIVGLNVHGNIVVGIHGIHAVSYTHLTLPTNREV